MDKAARKLTVPPAKLKKAAKPSPASSKKASAVSIPPSAAPVPVVAPRPLPVRPAVPATVAAAKDPDGFEFHDKLCAEWNKGGKEDGRDMKIIAKYLEEAKLKLINLKYLEENGEQIPPRYETLARDVLEIGVLYSIFKDEPDIKLFERYMSQLKPYYLDYGKTIPGSPQKYEILGANLLHLLSAGRLDDFHMEVERILHPPEMVDEIMEIVYIKRAIELERALEEGRYGQIHAQDGPQKKSGLWRYFVEKLTKSTRMQIAETMEIAYAKLSTAGIMDRLKFNTVQELEAFALQRKWKLVDGGCYCFNRCNAKEEQRIQSECLLQNALTYARELEMII